MELEESKLMTEPAPFELDIVELAIDELIVVMSDIDSAEDAMLVEVMLE